MLKRKWKYTDTRDMMIEYQVCVWIKEHVCCVFQSKYLLIIISYSSDLKNALEEWFQRGSISAQLGTNGGI